MAMNKDSFRALPSDVQKIVRDVDQEYSRPVGNTLMERYEAALKSSDEPGAQQAVPVKVAPMAPGEREKKDSTMPNQTGGWVKTTAKRGQAATIITTHRKGLGWGK